ncbi:MAG: hypothetical protein CM1200mP35_01130 [Chloroflexota bacterium]|nr:MAG: hypothetical protein CM1200mP35_01130 [Chloroflexota bacterium]
MITQIGDTVDEFVKSESKSVKANGIDVHYLERGVVGAPTVVMFHAIGMSAQSGMLSRMGCRMDSMFTHLICGVTAIPRTMEIIIPLKNLGKMLHGYQGIESRRIHRDGHSAGGRAHVDCGFHEPGYC